MRTTKEIIQKPIPSIKITKMADPDLEDRHLEILNLKTK